MTSPSQNLTVRLFSTTKRLFGAGELLVPEEHAEEVGSLLEVVCDNQEKRRGVFAAPGALRGDITVLVNGRNIAFLAGLGTPVQGGDVVSIIPPMAGG